MAGYLEQNTSVQDNWKRPPVAALLQPQVSRKGMLEIANSGRLKVNAFEEKSVN